VRQAGGIVPIRAGLHLRDAWFMLIPATVVVNPAIKHTRSP